MSVFTCVHKPLARLKALFKKRYIVIILEIVGILVIYFAIKAFMQRTLVDGPLPYLEGKLLNGTIININHHKGKPLMLHFWATWCSICKLEEKSIASISNDHTVITVAMNSGSAAKVSAYLEEQGLDYPVVVDEDGAIAARFGVRGVPTSFVADKNGNIVFTEVGFTTELGLRLRLWYAGF